MDTLSSGFALNSLTDDGTFSGYGSVFGNVDSHRDVVVKGAFKASIDEARATGVWPQMLLQHGLDDKMPIGIWTKMEEDSTGLYLEGKLALDNSRARDVYALMKMTPRPALNGLSIGYQPIEFVINDRASPARRTLKVVKLIEVSIVVSPSNPLATVRRVKSERGHVFRPVTSRTEAAANNFIRALAALGSSRHPRH
jgi:HK97 family phage prohead protease